MKYNLNITNEKNSFFVGFHYGTKTLTFAAENRYHVFQFSGGYSFGFKRGDFIHIQSDIIFREIFFGDFKSREKNQ